MSEQMYLELFALGGCLPGPTSTQLSFAMGTVKKGVLGELGEAELDVRGLGGLGREGTTYLPPAVVCHGRCEEGFAG